MDVPYFNDETKGNVMVDCTFVTYDADGARVETPVTPDRPMSPEEKAQLKAAWEAMVSDPNRPPVEIRQVAMSPAEFAKVMLRIVAIEDDVMRDGAALALMGTVLRQLGYHEGVGLLLDD